MQGIFVMALYTYAKTGAVPSAFDSDLIQNAFLTKQPGPKYLNFFFGFGQKVISVVFCPSFRLDGSCRRHFTGRDRNMSPRADNRFTASPLTIPIQYPRSPPLLWRKFRTGTTLPGKTAADRLVSLGIEKRRILDIRLLEEISATYQIPVYLFFEDDLARTRTLESVQEEYQSGS